jgi:hypothetical protein
MLDEIEQGDFSTTIPSFSSASQASIHSPLEPHSLGALLVGLLKQYLQALASPSPATFSALQGKANWRVVWLQVLGWASISALLAYVARLISPGPLMILGTPVLRMSVLQGQLHPIEAALGALLGVPLTFLLWMGLLYILARVVRGQGTFLSQLATTLLFQVPLGILISLLSLLPFSDGLSLAILGYGLLLQVFMVMAVHHQSGSKATLIVFLPALLIVVLLVTFALPFVGGVLLFCLLGAYLFLLW